jgi:hypothetical protein
MVNQNAKNESASEFVTVSSRTHRRGGSYFGSAEELEQVNAAAEEKDETARLMMIEEEVEKEADRRPLGVTSFFVVNSSTKEEGKEAEFEDFSTKASTLQKGDRRHRRGASYFEESSNLARELEQMNISEDSSSAGKGEVEEEAQGGEKREGSRNNSNNNNNDSFIRTYDEDDISECVSDFCSEDVSRYWDNKLE